MMSSFNQNNEPQAVDAEVTWMSGELDRLAAADRSAAPAGLESRIFESTLESFRMGEAPVVYTFATRPQWTGRLMRIAAMVVVVGAVGLAWWATRPPVLPGSSGGDPIALRGGTVKEGDAAGEVASAAVDEFFAVLASGGDTLASEIESLHSEAQRVSDSISAPSPGSWSEQPSGLGTIDAGSIEG